MLISTRSFRTIWKTVRESQTSDRVKAMYFRKEAWRMAEHITTVASRIFKGCFASPVPRLWEKMHNRKNRLMAVQKREIVPFHTTNIIPGCSPIVELFVCCLQLIYWGVKYSTLAWWCFASASCFAEFICFLWKSSPCNIIIRHSMIMNMIIRIVLISFHDNYICLYKMHDQLTFLDWFVCLVDTHEGHTLPMLIGKGYDLRNVKLCYFFRWIRSMLCHFNRI